MNMCLFSMHLKFWNSKMWEKTAEIYNVRYSRIHKIFENKFSG